MGTRVWSKGLDLRSNAIRFVGSNPTSCIPLVVAQLAEQWTVNPFVAGSSPANENLLAWMAEWSKAPDSSSGGRFVRVGSNPTSCIWFRGVMVSTLDFESNDPSSNLGETF
jgi:hypothetical protein